MSPDPAAFDAAAAGYDARFTDTVLGARLRTAAWTWMDQAFHAGDRILDLGCGTGADAVHLAERGVAVVATDASTQMCRAAERGAIVHGANDLVRVERLDMASIGDPGWADRLGAPFDGVISDFGALNAVAGRVRLLRALAATVRPGGHVILVVMGPGCPFEFGWHLLHLEPGIALRRWQAGARARVEGGGRLRVWYPSAGRVAREAAPWFEVVDRGGIGMVLPPSGLALAFERRRWWLRTLAPLERRLARGALGAGLADHWVIDLVRRGS